MIQSISFVNRFGRSLRCILREPERTNIAVRKVSGLGPGRATVNIHGIATADGGYFGSARFDKRVIELDLQFIEWSLDGGYVPIEQTRHLSYEFFAPKTRMQMVVETDERRLLIEGYVESNEPDIFSPNESAHITIICPGYYFKMVTDEGEKQNVSIYGNGLFSFPFFNEYSTQYKYLEFGTASAIQTYTLQYNGDMETGFDMTITFDGNQVSTMSIQNTPKGNSDKGPIGFANDFEASADIYHWVDDEITYKYVQIVISDIAAKLSGRLQGHVYDSGNQIRISSHVGKKSAYLHTLGGDKYNIIDAIRHLEWLQIYPGYNEFSVQTDNNSIGHFNVSVEYEALYSGV